MKKTFKLLKDTGIHETFISGFKEKKPVYYNAIQYRCEKCGKLLGTLIVYKNELDKFCKCEKPIPKREINKLKFYE